jgi:hypothetical protein
MRFNFFAHRGTCLTILLTLVVGQLTGCAYTLDTGNRKVDGCCHWIEKCAAPFARACAYTAAGAAYVAASVAGSAAEDACSGDGVCVDPGVCSHHSSTGDGESSAPSPPPGVKPLLPMIDACGSTSGSDLPNRSYIP